MTEGRYHFAMNEKQQDAIIAAVNTRSGWHWENSSRYPKSNDYDTDKEDKGITLAHAEIFMEKGGCKFLDVNC